METTLSRSELIASVMPMVRSIARELYFKTPAEYDDLVSDGSLGAIIAADHFDPDRGFKFSTFAAHRIRGAMLDGIRERDHLSRRMRQLAEEEDTRYQAPISLDKTIDGTDQAIGDLIPDSYDFVERVCDIECARWALEQVGERQRQVIVWHYWDDIPLWQIGEMLGFTESRACQIETDALHVMRVACIRAGLGIDPAQPNVRQAIVRRRGGRSGDRDVLYKDLADVWGFG